MTGLRQHLAMAALGVVSLMATGATLAADTESRSSLLVAQARALEHGEGVPKDPLRAAALYCEAARAFDTEAQYSLGWMYLNGRGVQRSDPIAASLFALAAAGGHPQAEGALTLLGNQRDALPDCMNAPLAWSPPALLPIERQSAGFVPLNPFGARPPWKLKIVGIVGKLAPRFAVDPRLALAVVAVESNFDPAARSPKDARGLMQLIPATAARFKVANAHDVDDNLRGGLAYLRWLLAYYRGHVAFAAAAYNAGEGAVDRYQGVPPYPETRDYVRRVLQLYGSERHPYDERIVEPSSIVQDADAGPS
jgi:soluble lytic murein transglycosylase-like protein